MARRLSIVAAKRNDLRARTDVFERNDRDSPAARNQIPGPRPTRVPGSATLGSSAFRRRHNVPKNYVRLTQPLVRDSKDAPLRPASWDEALARVVAGFQAAKAQHGPTTFGVFSCSKATNEVNFAAQKFSRTVLGSNNIDSCNRT
jgi:anaerobic selenocysteine-containing dehydrogenase